MKYINAVLLRNEIEKNKNMIDGLFTEGDDSVYDGENDAYNRVLRIIDSLQQEQQEADLDADIEMEWDSFNKHIAKYSEGAEEVVWLNWLSFVDIANYFYKLGFNAKEENK